MNRIHGTSLYYNNGVVIDKDGTVLNGTVNILRYNEIVSINIDWLILMHKFKIHSVDLDISKKLINVMFVKHKYSVVTDRPDSYTIYIKKPIQIGKFRVIPKYPKYGISDSGDIISFKSGNIRTLNSILKKSKKYVKHNNYPFIYLYDERLGSSQKVYIHKILATCWVDNDDWENKTIVNHIDHNKFNPSIENLEWVTPSGNTIAYYKNKDSV